MWHAINRKHFNGALTPVPICITRSRRTYGYYNGPNTGGRPSIRISWALAVAEPETLENTMAHEMIHQFLHERYEPGAEDWAEHGPDFQHHHRRIFGHLYVEST